MPFESAARDGNVVVTDIMDRSSCPSLEPGDLIRQWKQYDVPTPEVLEFLVDYEKPGTVSVVTYTRDGVTAIAEVTTIPYYGIGYVIMVFLIGLCSWVLGLYVLLMRQGQLEAAVLHWGMMGLGTVVVVAWEGITPDQSLVYISSVLFFVSYIGVAATFLFFTSLFPRRSAGSIGVRAGIIYLLAVLPLGPVLYFHSRAIFFSSVSDYLVFQIWFDVFHIVVFLFIAGAILNFIVSFVQAESSVERRKIQWLAFGFCTGPTPFILLTIIPTLLSAEWTIPEKYTLGFLILVPITFVISFVRYHLFDIEVVIQRTAVYGLVLGTLLLVYVSAVALFAVFIGSYASETYALSAVLVGLLFEPARRRVTAAVDRTFFRVRYSFREAARSFGEDIRHCLDLRELGKLLVTRTDSIIPVERIGLLALLQPGGRFRMIASRGFDEAGSTSPPIQLEMSGLTSEIPMGVTASMEPGIEHATADKTLFTRHGLALVVPMHSEELGPLGLLALGPKKSGRRFTIEDVDLVRSFMAQSALSIERIILQRQLILKQAEAEHLAELNELKSDFVSYVSHELKTPLTSIKLFAELLGEQQRGLDERGREFLGTIEGETDRLNRMVSTILNSAEIEHGVKEFNKERIDLVQVARDSISTMDYQLAGSGFQVESSFPGRPVLILADRDAVFQCLLNLIANAVKYSGDIRYIRVSVSRLGGEPACTVEDHGIGIPPESRKRIFERFYRGSARRSGRNGVGLGLPLVKHIMDAHGGRIEVQSKPGDGSCFTLLFPQEKKEAQ